MTTSDIRFIIACIILVFVIDLVEKTNKQAAWILVIILILGMLIRNQGILYWISSQLNNADLNRN